MVVSFREKSGLKFMIIDNEYQKRVAWRAVRVWVGMKPKI